MWRNIIVTQTIGLPKYRQNIAPNESALIFVEYSRNSSNFVCITFAQYCISLSYEEVYRQCAAVTNVISDRKEQAKDFTVKYVTVLMGFMDLHDQYRQKIENWQRKAVDYEVELEELRTQLQKRNLNKHVPEVALKLACLMKTDSNENRQPFLQILSDLICNKEKETKRWSDETKSLFAVILNYGGPALAKIIKDRLGGPHQQYTERLQVAISFHRILQIVPLRWLGFFMIRSVILDHLFLQLMRQLLLQHCVSKETELLALQQRMKFQCQLHKTSLI